MNILMLVFNQTGQGTYWRAHALAGALALRGHTLTLLSTSPRARLRLHARTEGRLRLVETPDLLPGPLRSGWDPFDTLRRMLWALPLRFDLVHAFETRPANLYPALLAARRGAKLVFDWADWFGTGGSLEERPSRLARAALRPFETYHENHFRTRAAGTTVINTFLGQRAISLGVSPESILLLRNGSRLTPPLSQAEARAQTGLPQGQPLIGFVGGTYPKDAELMAHAFDRVLRGIPHARLLLVGYFNRDLEALVERPEAILRTGPLPTEALHPHLSACDLCWLPLTDTGANRGRWPLKLNDYMAVGRATVATDVGDLKSVITAHQLGAVTPPDPQALAAKTILLLNDPERRAALGANARRAAETVFDWAVLSRELEAFYLRI